MKKNKNILLIGGNSGIGLQLKEDLIVNNNVFYTSSKKKNSQNYLNFNDVKSVKRTIIKAYKKFNYFDFIIFNSFISKKRKEFSKFNLKAFQETLNANIFSHILIMKLIIKQKKKSKLIFISTEAIKNSSWGLSQYTMAKSALEIFLKTLSNENKNLETKIIRLKKYNTPGYLRVNGNIKNTKSMKLASKYILENF